MDNVIFSYSRAEAIAEGVLIDVSELAREAGIRPPTALTAAAWHRVVAVPDELRGEQDETGRLWDVLNLFRFAVLKREDAHDSVEFVVAVREIRAGGLAHELLKGCWGCGDAGELVATIMLPDED